MVLRSETIFASEGQAITVSPLDGNHEEGVMEILCKHRNTVKTMRVPVAWPGWAINRTEKPQHAFSNAPPRGIVCMTELWDGRVITLDLAGTANIWQIRREDLEKDLGEWKKLAGDLGSKPLSIIRAETKLGSLVRKSQMPLATEVVTAKGRGRGRRRLWVWVWFWFWFRFGVWNWIWWWW
ncbi:hypothetical protein BC829DRAFT_1128 [Chytridium lagenaria]|nr:hypothetical protein BC829DRAFT_1128 [Chytridium lagenaria]